MLVGIKPTVGLISRYGIIPITADQDTAGPITRTVTDAAIMLGAMVGPDANDVAGTNRCIVPPGHDYTRVADARQRCAARASAFPARTSTSPTINPATGASVGGLNAAQTAVMNDAIAVLRREGAVIVDPANIPSIVDGTPANNFLSFGVCSGLANARGLDTAVLGGAEVWNEARLQPLRAVARARRRRSSRSPSCGSTTSPTARAVPSSTTRPTWTSRMR